MESVNVRNLEQIQEQDAERRNNRLLTFLLASVGGAALVVVVVMMTGHASDGPAVAKPDALGALVQQAKAEQGALPGAGALDGRDVSFPGLLSDDAEPTTALAAVKDERGQLVNQLDSPNPLATAVPAGASRLPQSLQATGSLLNETSVTSAPKDGLTALAVSVSRTDGNAEPAPAGSADGFQLQIASFKEQADADALVDELRKRGHRAFSIAADVPGRGIWHRVRIGSFKTKFEASQYKSKFEATERMAPYLIDPEAVRRAAELRAAKIKDQAD
jgi:cell division septation protein DedD